MELTLTRQAGTQVLVTCDDRRSHTFDLLTLIPGENGLPQPLDDPVAYGKAIYQALFPMETAARRELEARVEGILLVTTDDAIDAIPWEYAYGTDGFLVLECHFVRGLPADQRIVPPILDSGLHIVAVPSNPLSHNVEPLNIDGEWTRLKEIIQEVPHAIILERTRPPTIEQVGHLLANQRHHVVHFMGHGGEDERGAVLCFEKNNGDLDNITAKQFILHVQGAVFLATLNACASATPGPTAFDNLAAALMKQKIPYALGMRFSIVDEDALIFSRAFYSDLARGASVEEALFQARLALSKSSRLWVIGVPVLYTSLKSPSAGFACVTGKPTVKEHQSRKEVNILPRAEGTFLGRIDELKALGEQLTGDSRPPVITIHGGGGQGKTALAREAIERFAYAWPGGVWATSLENLPSRELFVNDLAQFLGIDTRMVLDLKETERLVVAQLVRRRTLIVLDNAETLVEAVEANNEEAVRLAQFIREHLPRPPVSVLATSRTFLGWAGEIGCELPGLAPVEGVRLFQQYAPQREKEIDRVLVWELSEKIEGHPLSLRLLSSTFNASTIPLSLFVEEYQAHLLEAEDKYRDIEHRHRTLCASFEMSIRYLGDRMRSLLSGLWIFHAPFLPETAAAIFDQQTDDTAGKPSSIYDQLQGLWKRGLLTCEMVIEGNSVILLYHLLSVGRSYVERYLEQTYQRKALLMRFGAAYAQFADSIFLKIDRSAATVYVARLALEDLERGAAYATGIKRGYYQVRLGWILQRLGSVHHGLKLIEQALEIAQGQDRHLESTALNIMAALLDLLGQRQQALTIYEEALSIQRETGDRRGEVTTLRNIAELYRVTGQPQRALELFEQTLPIFRETGDRIAEAVTLKDMAGVYRVTGQPQRALELFEQVLLICREIGDLFTEASTLNNMALAYRAIGQPERALTAYEQSLSIDRRMSNRVGEATTLNNIAAVYIATGQLQQAMEALERALSIQREVSDRVGEATTLHNMAEIYRIISQPQRALELFEQALRLRREVGDRAGEATTLNNIAIIQGIERPQEALGAFERVFSIQREVGDRSGEATTLNNMARIYYAMGQRQRALELFEQALAIQRGIGNLAGEALVLNNIAEVYRSTDRPGQALELFKQALSIQRAVGDRVTEANTLANLAMLYWSLKRSQEAINSLEQAITIFLETGLSEDAAGQTVDDLRQTLKNMRATAAQLKMPAGSSAKLSAKQIQQIIANTVAVLTSVKDRRAEWRGAVTEMLQRIRGQEQDWKVEIDFFNAILMLLDGQATELPVEHPYAPALTEIQASTAAAHLQNDGNSEDDDKISFNDDLVPRSIAALLGEPQEKMMYVQFLAKLSAQTTDEGLKGLIQAIQLALFGSDLSHLGQNLNGLYKEVWEAIIIGVQTGGVDPHLFEVIIRNTLAVFGPLANKRGEWHNELTRLRKQAMEDGAEDLGALLDSVIRLLDAEGNPIGLGGNLAGIYAQTWRAIVDRLA